MCQERHNNAILEIRPAAGGAEASLFATELLKMYIAWAQNSNYKIEMLDDLSIMIIGSGAFEKLKYESGVHRVQRVPQTETQGRIHTSTVTVAVLPEATHVNFQINDRDLKIDVYRASGAGGQHVNRTESAVRITHLPTNTVVTCQENRSQIQNRARAMLVLQSKLVEYYQNLENSKRSSDRKTQIGTGDRSEKIRTYNFPQDRVTDHRINFSLHNLPRVLCGKIDALLSNLQSQCNQ